MVKHRNTSHSKHVKLQHYLIADVSERLSDHQTHSHRFSLAQMRFYLTVNIHILQLTQVTRIQTGKTEHSKQEVPA